jgi:hypothetical protein
LFKLKPKPTLLLNSASKSSPAGKSAKNASSPQQSKPG